MRTITPEMELIFVSVFVITMQHFQRAVVVVSINHFYTYVRFGISIDLIHI